jgi:hypothetical protein
MPWCGAPPKVLALSTTKRSHPTFRDQVSFPDVLPTRSCGTRSGTTSNHASFTLNRSGHQWGLAPRYGRNGCDSSPSQRTPIHGLTQLDFSSSLIYRAGPQRIEPMLGVTIDSSPRLWTSMLHFTSPLWATSGCYVTDPLHCLLADSSAGPPVSGPRKRSSWHLVGVSAYTGKFRRPRLESRTWAWRTKGLPLNTSGLNRGLSVVGGCQICYKLKRHWAVANGI